MSFDKRWLLVLLVITIGTSILHYVDNILFFHAYPEPHWINLEEKLELFNQVTMKGDIS